MDYKPPRGKCNHKTSLMTPACACLRFMLHPIKAATSFECDGCGHHASFHSLENPSEDAVLERWAEKTAEEEREMRQAMGGAGKKRKLLTQAAAVEEILIVDDVSPPPLTAALKRNRAEAKKPAARKTGISAQNTAHV
ncbi:hypothetical protein Tdes44962_MAKER07885 [Teratosphaeria destructans]|uniref:Uncharacterized protein n=1 Tax=Teratosphaeria destructans TaxID=418781 RepID=A0A9W7SXS1_9PEZI|nr:hypothetical protein Tdes44962_MAKER07885 [Teratosphaeria destructans]